MPPLGDDEASSFDTTRLDLIDPEGIAYNSDTGNLYLAGKTNTIGNGNFDTLLEVTTAGVLVQTIDVAAAKAIKLSGLAYAPSSLNPGHMSIYIADRGIDNDSDPDENDGKIYEMSLPSLSGNHAPSLNAGPDQTLTLPAAATLPGAVTDDGLPSSSLTTTWSMASGPGTVDFGDAHALNTTATFSSAGLTFCACWPTTAS